MIVAVRTVKLIGVLAFLLTVVVLGEMSLKPNSKPNTNPPHAPKQRKGGSAPRVPTDDAPGKGDKDEMKFCSAVNPLTGSFVDLSWLSSTPNEGNREKSRNKKDEAKTRWLVKGWDYNTNFTMAICSSSVVSELQEQLSNTTGAYYVDHSDNDKLVSIGEVSSSPRFVGKKLTLTYENGESCPNGIDRKSTLINLICDKEIATKAQISFVGQLHNCSYFFEVRSIHACPVSNVENDVNVVGIFASIVAVFLLIEFARRKLYESLNRSKPRSINESTLPPRWVNAEDEPLWRRLAKRLPWPKEQNVVRLRTRDNSALTVDMEQQNELLDSLDVETNSAELQ